MWIWITCFHLFFSCFLEVALNCINICQGLLRWWHPGKIHSTSNERKPRTSTSWKRCVFKRCGYTCIPYICTKIVLCCACVNNHKPWSSQIEARDLWSFPVVSCFLGRCGAISRCTLLWTWNRTLCSEFGCKSGMLGESATDTFPMMGRQEVIIAMPPKEAEDFRSSLLTGGVSEVRRMDSCHLVKDAASASRRPVAPNAIRNISYGMLWAHGPIDSYVHICEKENL